MIIIQESQLKSYHYASIHVLHVCVTMSIKILNLCSAWARIQQCLFIQNFFGFRLGRAELSITCGGLFSSLPQFPRVDGKACAPTVRI